MINFGEGLRKGLGFMIEPNRWLPLFALDAAALLIAVFGMMSGLSAMMDSIVEIETNPVAVMPLVGMLAWFLLLGTVWYLLRLWMFGAIIHQSDRPNEYGKSFRVSFNNMHKLIMATVIVSLVASIVSMIPYVGWILAIVISLAWFFVFQGIIIDRLGSVSTLRNSWKIFRKNPLDVFVSWFLIAIISSVVALVFALPLLVSVSGYVIGMAATGAMDSYGLAMFLIYLQDNAMGLTLLGLLALIGVELAQVFSLRAQTDFYLQLKKSYPSLLKEFSRKLGKFF